MSRWVILRGGVTTATVGPFDSEAEALAWQAADETAHGPIDDASVWPLYSPDEASRVAAGGDA